jgi:hypothetical protein
LAAAFSARGVTDRKDANAALPVGGAHEPPLGAEVAAKLEEARQRAVNEVGVTEATGTRKVAFGAYDQLI